MITLISPIIATPREAIQQSMYAISPNGNMGFYINFIFKHQLHACITYYFRPRIS